MSARSPMLEPASPTVIVLEPNRRVGQRIARVIASAVGLDRVAYVERHRDLEALVGANTRLVACGAADAHAVVPRMASAYPEVKLMVWASEPAERMVALARSAPGLSNIVAWPSFQSMPRPWELAMAARRLVMPHGPVPGPSDLVRWGATVLAWRPGTTMDRDVVVAEVSQVVLQLAATSRAAERIAELVHELLMNAMYAAPVDEQGRPRYAYDRTRDVVLAERERPTLTLATDGMLLAVQVEDPFGGLGRQRVLDSVARGLAAADQVDAGGIVDASHGGAGLGLAKLYACSAVLLVDVMAGSSTRVTSVHELDLSPREMRGLPRSLHYFAC